MFFFGRVGEEGLVDSNGWGGGVEGRRVVSLNE